jgi:hypothetical protein
MMRVCNIFAQILWHGTRVYMQGQCTRRELRKVKQVDLLTRYDHNSRSRWNHTRIENVLHICLLVEMQLPIIQEYIVIRRK